MLSSRRSPSRRGRWRIRGADGGGCGAPAGGLGSRDRGRRARDDDAFVVIAHPSCKGGAIRRQLLAEIFLGKVTEWGDRTPIQPVDQSTRSAVRASFSLRVLNLPLSSVQFHWERQIVSHGGHPPAIKSSDDEVIAVVASTPGAIGYVSADAPTTDAVKILKIVD
jgi:ABC-type phosphate transport system substrate-binding protein